MRHLLVAAISLVAVVLVFAATRPEPPPPPPPGVLIAVAAADIAPGTRIAADAITQVEARIEGVAVGRFLGWERAVELVEEAAVTRRRLSPGDPLLVSDITPVGGGKRIVSFPIPAPSTAAVVAGDVVDFVVPGPPEVRRIVAERIAVVALEGGNITVFVDEDELFALLEAALSGTVWPARTSAAAPFGTETGTEADQSETPPPPGDGPDEGN